MTSTLFLSMNLVATGTGCRDRRVGSITILNSSGNIVLNRIIKSDPDEIYDPLTKISGLTRQQLYFGFPLAAVEHEITQRFQGFHIVVSNDLNTVDRFLPRLQETNTVENFSTLFKTTDDLYFSVKEFAKSILGIELPRAYNNPVLICDIMRDGMNILKYYDPKDTEHRLLQARQMQYAPYVPYKVFNGICMSTYNSTNCKCTP